MNILHQLSRWSRTSSPRSREIVLEILKSAHPAPVAVQDLYQQIRKNYAHEKVPIPEPLPNPRLGFNKKDNPKRPPPPEPPLPPHPDHPIRSLKFLKLVLLPELQHQGKVEKIHTMRPPTAEELQRKNERPMKLSKKHKRTAAPTIAFNSKGMIDQWGWILNTDESREVAKEEKLRINKAIEGQKRLDPKVQAKYEKRKEDEEWGHLNTRRRRAREGKEAREDAWAATLERARQEGVAAKS